jgi:pimeloyl-ACP methyl ester carboxylesterase
VVGPADPVQFAFVIGHSSLTQPNGRLVEWRFFVIWLWLSMSLAVVGALTLIGAYAFHVYIVRKYIGVVARIFQEKPLFMIPFGKPREDAEDLNIPSTDGVILKGCYLKTKQPRQGVIFFGLEFGSKRWSCVPYCDFLLDAGYDIFACEARGQGDTPTSGDYEPLQWITEYEIYDYKAALAYLKSRPDADAHGVGLFGLSKGGGAGLFVAADDPYIRCCVTDGIFGTLTTVVPYMAQWVMIYTKRHLLASFLPKWYFRLLAKRMLRGVAAERRVHYPSLAPVLRKLAPRPLFMIHGGADSYIKPEMARSLFDSAQPPKELWIVDNAKHNQAFHLVGDEYKRRVRAFFDEHLRRAVREPVAEALKAN